MGRGPLDARFMQMLKSMKVDDCALYPVENPELMPNYLRVLHNWNAEKRWPREGRFRSVVYENKLYVIRVA